MHIHHNDCEWSYPRSSIKTWDIKSQPAKGPSVNRSLKPQKLICQVTGSKSNAHGIHKSSGIKSESSPSIQPDAMPTRLSTEKPNTKQVTCSSTPISCKNARSRNGFIPKQQSQQNQLFPNSKTETDCTTERATVHRGNKQMPPWPHPVTIPKVPVAEQKQIEFTAHRTIKQMPHMQIPGSTLIVPGTEQASITHIAHELQNVLEQE
ncbi:uncharacterized protein LOC142750778 [Rhinoderma darwinii]|uniref:uncharacterized protein LOC142750778 n=1 Tax=Rhinoderma darwinii TaxID=43563 RepID=UPI003F66C87C